MSRFPPGPRYRRNDDILPTSVTGVLTYIPSGSIGATYVEKSMEKFQDMNDVVVPNAKKLISEGHIFNNPANRRDFEFVSSPFLVTNRKNSDGTGYNASNYTVSRLLDNPAWGWTVSGKTTLDLTSEIEKLSSLARQAAIAKMDKTPYTFIEDLLEIRKTVALLRHPLEPLVDIGRKIEGDLGRRLTTLKRGKGRGNPNLPDTTFQVALAKSWLTYRFVYGQTLMSAMNVRDALQDQLILQYNKPDVRRKSRAKFSSRLAAADTVIRTNGYTVTSSEVQQYEAEVSAGILYTVKKPAINFAFATGTRLKDVPTGLWQIVPYSWALDRMLDLTSTIKGLINLGDPNLVIHAAWVKSQERRNSTRQVLSWTQPGYTISASNGGPEIIIDNSWSRKPWVPTVNDTLPTFDLDGVKKEITSVLDLASLATSLLLGGRYSRKKFDPRR